MGGLAFTRGPSLFLSLDVRELKCEVGLVTLAGEEGDKHIEMSPGGRGHSDWGRASLWAALLMNGDRGLYESLIRSLVFSIDIYFYLFKYAIQAQKCFGSTPKLPIQEN